MTTAEPTMGPARRGRATVIALVLSLVFNAFLVGLIWGHLHFQFRHRFGPLQRLEHISREMHLSGPQHAAFDRMIATMHKRWGIMHHENRPIFDQVWDQLAKPHPDDQAISDLITRADQNRRMFQKDATVAMKTFLATLPADQRAQFVDRAKRERPPAPR